MQSKTVLIHLPVICIYYRVLKWQVGQRPTELKHHRVKRGKHLSARLVRGSDWDMSERASAQGLPQPAEPRETVQKLPGHAHRKSLRPKEGGPDFHLLPKAGKRSRPKTKKETRYLHRSQYAYTVTGYCMDWGHNLLIWKEGGKQQQGGSRPWPQSGREPQSLSHAEQLWCSVVVTETWLTGARHPHTPRAPGGRLQGNGQVVSFHGDSTWGSTAGAAPPGNGRKPGSETF